MPCQVRNIGTYGISHSARLQYVGDDVCCLITVPKHSQSDRVQATKRLIFVCAAYHHAT